MAELDELVAKMEKVRVNPAAMQRLMLDELELATNGAGRVPDPTNPFVFLMESAVTHTAMAIQATQTLTRQQYPSLAQTDADLYRHMSDKDYIGRFGTPSRTAFTILIGKDELYQKAIAVSGSRVKKLVIPRHTEFLVSGYKFTMQYPIELRIMAHGGLQVVYDVSKSSPLQTLESNVVNWKMINFNDVDYVRLDIPVQQIEIVTHYAKLNNTSGFTQSYAINDEYYYCRVYSSNSDGSWSEIRTTHTDQVFDQSVPTVVLRVESDALRLHVPPIYFTTGLMDKELRVDIYTTKGPLDFSLMNYDVNAFTATWRDIEGDDNGLYTSPLASFNSISVFSTSIVTGGSVGLSFEELRERVLGSNLGSVDIPITNVHLSSYLEDRGYRLVKNVDNITNRIYQATRALPTPTDLSTVSGIGTRIGVVQRSMESLKTLDSVNDNGNRITLQPSTLYMEVDGIISPADNGVTAYVKSLGTEAQAMNVNTNNYLYTPFHYVLDVNNNVFDVRPYYLDKPSVESRVFVAENDTALLEISTESYSIQRYVDGYEILLMTRSGETYRGLSDEQLHVHLSYTPVGENNRAFLQGELIGVDPESKERVWRFFLSTNNDVNVNDQILLTSFKLLDAETERNFAASLLTDFDVVYGVSDYTVPGLQVSSLDRYLAPYLLPEGVASYVGVVQERLTVRLGYALNGLWSKSRTVVSSFDYEVYEADVPMTYETNVYEMDPLSGGIKLYEDGGSFSYNLLHAQGDEVKDELGVTLLKHLKGDLRLDASGNPIIRNPRGLLRQMEMFLLDGKYYFATDEITHAYRESIPMHIVDWLEKDITPLSKRMLENTELFYYPQASLGRIEAIVDGGDSVSIPAEQSFLCQVFVTRQGYMNTELRSSIVTTIKSIIAEALLQASVSMNEIVSKITTTLGDDIIAVKVEGLGGSMAVNTLTMKDDSARPVIRKYLAVGTDGRLSVQDDISIDFTRHDT